MKFWIVITVIARLKKNSYIIANLEVLAPVSALQFLYSMNIYSSVYVYYMYNAL